MVYAKPCLGHREQVLSYPARYTHRIALSGHRPVEGKNGRIGLQCQDCADQGREKRLRLQPEELIRRLRVIEETPARRFDGG